MSEGPATRAILDRLTQATGHQPRHAGISYTTRCPTHEDRAPSLSITPIEGSVLLHCHAGCPTDTILKALNLTLADLYDDKRGATYTYDSGRVVHRTPTKRFYQKGDLTKVELYHLAQLNAAGPGAIYLVEGEKDVHAIEAAGAVATTAPMGAANFDKVDIRPLADRHIIAVVDLDNAGKTWARLVHTTLHGHCQGIRYVHAATGKDAADHIAAGHTLDQLIPYDLALPEHPDPSPDDQQDRRLVAVAASTLSMRSPTWLYEWRIPTGAITLIGGREGIGKTSISYNLAAALTRGTLPGAHYGTPRNVGIVAVEDAWAEVVIPRLHAAGADLDRIYLIEARQDGRPETPSVPADLDRLEQLRRDYNLALVLLDPLMSVIHSAIDTHKDREVRIALDPLARFAATSGAAVLGLLHANKSTTTDPLNSLMASRAFSAVARSVLYCITDPEAEREDRYLFGHVKSNLGPRQPTIGYHLIAVQLDLNGSGTLTTSKAIWDGEDQRSIRDVMETPRATRAESEPAARVIAWVTEQGRLVASAEIHTAFPDMKRGPLDRLLARLVERGKLNRPLHGMYGLPQNEEKGTK